MSSPTPLRNPYYSLVSEAMLQQTQVSRVIERFTRFITRFPTLEHLAAAHPDDVLAEWSGLGYYRRARNLHAAAVAIVSQHNARIPHTLDHLLELPGVGRYTAGAIASIAFGHPAPIVDGNVARVLMRLHARPGAPASPANQRWLWKRADELARAAASAHRSAPSRARHTAAFNEGLMELGATICLPAPAKPRCDQCPLADVCLARRRGTQSSIPPPKRTAARSTLFCASALITRPDGRILLHQRPSSGVLWSSMWQSPTLEHPDRPPTPSQLRTALGLPRAARLTLIDTFDHTTTHRSVRFNVYRATLPPAHPLTLDSARWVRPQDLHTLALSTPQRRILDLTRTANHP